MAAMAGGADLVPFSFTRRPLRENDILIAVKYCGLCHSDLHQVKNDWKGGTWKSKHACWFEHAQVR